MSLVGKRLFPLANSLLDSCSICSTRTIFLTSTQACDKLQPRPHVSHSEIRLFNYWLYLRPSISPWSARRCFPLAVTMGKLCWWQEVVLGWGKEWCTSSHNLGLKLPSLPGILNLEPKVPLFSFYVLINHLKTSASAWGNSCWDHICDRWRGFACAAGHQRPGSSGRSCWQNRREVGVTKCSRS